MCNIIGTLTMCNIIGTLTMCNIIGTLTMCNIIGTLTMCNIIGTLTMCNIIGTVIPSQDVQSDDCQKPQPHIDWNPCHRVLVNTVHSVKVTGAGSGVGGIEQAEVPAPGNKDTGISEVHHNRTV